MKQPYQMGIRYDNEVTSLNSIQDYDDLELPNIKYLFSMYILTYRDVIVHTWFKFILKIFA